MKKAEMPKGGRRTSGYQNLSPCNLLIYFQGCPRAGAAEHVHGLGSLIAQGSFVGHTHGISQLVRGSEVLHRQQPWLMSTTAYYQ